MKYNYVVFVDNSLNMLFNLLVLLFSVLLISDGNCDINTNVIKLLELLSTNNNDKDLSPKIKVIFPKYNYDNNKSKHRIDYEDKKQMIIDGKYLKPILRGHNEDKREKSKTGKLLRYQHKKKMDELTNFLRDHYSSTNYFYSEMLRIKRQYAIKDEMREMIDYLEEPGNWKLKNKILNVFKKLKKKREAELSLWNPKTNNLVINVLKDPYNDGVGK